MLLLLFSIFVGKCPEERIFFQTLRKELVKTDQAYSAMSIHLQEKVVRFIQKVPSSLMVNASKELKGMNTQLEIYSLI